MTKKISIELTEEQLAEINKIYVEGDLEPKTTEVWKPKDSEIYYYVKNSCYVDSYKWYEDRADTGLWSLGNCYRTLEEAESAAKHQEALIKVLGYIRENFGDWKPDWKSGRQNKYYIVYSHLARAFSFSSEYCMQSIALEIPYFQTEEQAQEIIDKFGSELRLIWGLK